ncbi:Cysteine desulfurase [Thalassoglobus neptunius]|uniref:Cysteine desulfurase n=1 Tax=Thalassoglobus neptunius TaxID=1938619 RepID=A0A5C5X5A3_9PLAN|nr:cysteine desulfurase family protein [Thalassoglobus neptunius]TWT57433.1 Cysteine desulfurase [Thalassoglobus neptunius]
MIYLDNNATTPVAEEVLEEMARVSRVAYGNPGSRHLAGRKARQVLEDSREVIAEVIGCSPDEVVFTSGGTESSNLAIAGLTAGRKGTVILPPAEHPATEEAVKRLSKTGSRKHRLRLDGQGQLVKESLTEAPWDDAVLATALLAHNETGTVLDLQEISELCEQHGVPFHVDAVQAVGKIPVSFRRLKATTMSVASHKFCGPRGIGALIVRDGTRVIPQSLGGHQEQGRRAGTESVALAAGMARAMKLFHQNMDNHVGHLRSLRDHFQAGLASRCAPFVVNGCLERRLPNTLHAAFPGCNADALLVALDLAGICCSHGSACASGSSEPAPILLAMQLPSEIYSASIRFSIGPQNTMEEIDAAVQIISETVQRLRS